MTHEGETVPPLRVVREDLVARLRHYRRDEEVLAGEVYITQLAREAADEIERLRMIEMNRNADLAQMHDAYALTLANNEHLSARAEQAEARLARVRIYCEVCTERPHTALSDHDIRKILALLDGDPQP